MRRIHLGALMLALPVLVASLLVVGCGRDNTAKTEGGGGGEGGEKKKASRELKPVAAKGGVVKGKITLKGSPDAKKMNDELLAEINKNAQKNECKQGEGFEHEEFVYRIGDNKQVGNVFVWLAPEKDEYFQLDDKQVEELKSHPVVIDQPHCAFIPHCSIYVPSYRDPKDPKKEKKTGQEIFIKNSADFQHNTNVQGTSFNQSIPPKSKEKLSLKMQKGEPYNIVCNIHGWMRGYIRTFDHPYAAISLAEPQTKPSDASFGSYEIKNTPVGKVRIVAWHEKAGYLNKNGLEGDEITIKQDQPLELNFELEAK